MIGLIYSHYKKILFCIKLLSLFVIYQIIKNITIKKAIDK